MAGDFDNSVSVSLSAKVNEKPFYAARVYEFISLLTQQFRDVTRKVRHFPAKGFFHRPTTQCIGATYYKIRYE